MTIQGIDHVGWYVNDLDGSSAALCHEWGFRLASQPVQPGWPGPEPAARGRSLLLRQGQVTLQLTAGLDPDHPAAQYVRRHGDGVATIAFRTDDVHEAFSTAVAAGAEPLAAPSFADHDGNPVGSAIVSGFGDVTHLLVQSEQAADAGEDGDMLETIDHVAVCVPAGQLDATVAFYHDAFGLTQVFDERVEANGQAMLSKVVQDQDRSVTFTLIEPDSTLEPGQIDQFLDAHGGAGVQHLAFGTADIAHAVRTISARGVEFLTAPPGYYQTLEARLGSLAIPASELEELNVLADRDRWGDLFQIFTRSTHERHTFFMELIERQGALTFGSANIRALYEALGKEQAPATLPT
jgi:4-hydroxymandelate synthase